MNSQVSINVQKNSRFLDVILEWPSFKIRPQKIGRFFLDAYDVRYKIVSIVVTKNRPIFCTRFLKRPSFQKKCPRFGDTNEVREWLSIQISLKKLPDFFDFQTSSSSKKNRPIFWTRFANGQGSSRFANIKEFKQSIQ